MADIELQDRNSKTKSKSNSKSNITSSNNIGNMFGFFSRNSADTEQQRVLKYSNNGEYLTQESLEEPSFISNKIKTSKYSLLTFLPLNLFEQIIRPANFYFCIIAALQWIPEVSISGGTPTILLPLSFVLTVTAIKDALEDLKRHKDDKEENQRVIEILQNDGSFTTKLSEQVCVGEIVRIKDHQRFPADILLISSAKGHKAPYCYVETSNIDGETNLKLKQSPEGFNTLPSFDNFDRISLRLIMKDNRASASFIEYKKRLNNNCVIESSPPNGHLDIWNGMIKHIQVPILNNNNNNHHDSSSSDPDNDDMDMDDNKQKELDNKRDEELFAYDFSSLSYDIRNIRLNFDNLCLRGSELRNSDWIYGLVIYTGFDCKIFQNNKSASQQRIKRSSVEKTLNKFIYYMAGAQFFICLMCSILAGDWTSSNNSAWYLYFDIEPELDAFYKFFTWFIIFAQFIPISLLVSMEVVKFIQAQYMQWDINMYTRLRGGIDKFCTVQNSNLNEELGQIDFVFSDKTGTLTDNSLDFRKCVIGDQTYGTGETEIGRAAKRRQEELSQQIERQQQNRNSDHKDNDDNYIPFKIQRAYTSDISTVIERNNNAPHVNFDEELRLRKQLKIGCLNSSKSKNNKNNKNEHSELVKRFCTVLAINNSCYPVFDDNTNSISIRAASPDDECLTCFAQFIGIQLTERNPPSIKVDIYPDGNYNSDSTHYKENWEQLAELEFTSKRKRMSIIARNLQTGKIHFTMKGADSEMRRLIHNYNDNKYSKTVEKYLEEYSEEGLRTLVIAEAILDYSWWDNNKNGGILKKFNRFQEDTLIMEDTDVGHIKGSCSDKCRKCIFYELLELDAQCELLGCTGIEDKLQESVPETISAMLDGGINVWVLTGDKQKTAENIGIACNLLEPNMERSGLLFKLVVSESHLLSATMNNAIETILNYNKNNKYSPDHLKQSAGLVLNSIALKTIMDIDHDEDLKTLFLTLAKLCKSVIGVRLQPNQKAQIVSFISERTNARTLAIGDGTNDEPMIRTANVGVGIAGLEGTAAVRASDYAIGKFKFLKRLMFVHGRLNYRRITTLVCYMFYKNGLLSLSSFYFGFYNGFSGQILYNEWAYQLYNIVFTCVPILLYAVIDRDHTDKYLINHPSLYSISQSGEYFNAKVFFTWIADSLFASFLLIFIPLQCYGYITSPDHSGQSSGIWTTGVVVLTSIVFTANIRLSIITNSWIWITHLFLWGSIAAFFLFMILFNLTHQTPWAKAGSDYYWIMFRVMQTGRFWLTVLLTTLIALFSPFTYVAFTNLRKNAKIMENEQQTREFNNNSSQQQQSQQSQNNNNNQGLMHDMDSSNDSVSSKEPLKGSKK